MRIRQIPTVREIFRGLKVVSCVDPLVLFVHLVRWQAMSKQHVSSAICRQITLEAGRVAKPR